MGSVFLSGLFPEVSSSWYLMLKPLFFSLLCRDLQLQARLGEGSEERGRALYWNRRPGRNPDGVIQDVLWHYRVLNVTAALRLVPGKHCLHPALPEPPRLMSLCSNYPLGPSYKSSMLSFSPGQSGLNLLRSKGKKEENFYLSQLKPEAGFIDMQRSFPLELQTGISGNYVDRWRWGLKSSFNNSSTCGKPILIRMKSKNLVRKWMNRAVSCSLEKWP